MGIQLLFGSLYTSQLILGTTASSLAASASILAANLLFAHHDASHNVNQLELQAPLKK